MLPTEAGTTAKAKQSNEYLSKMAMWECRIVLAALPHVSAVSRQPSGSRSRSGQCSVDGGPNPTE